MTCAGDSTAMCGAASRLTVFNSTTLVQLPGNPTIPNYTYKGCYTDSVGARTLTDVVMFDSAMTAEKCAARCSGFTYFGMEYGGGTRIFPRKCFVHAQIKTNWPMQNATAETRSRKRRRRLRKATAVSSAEGTVWSIVELVIDCPCTSCLFRCRLSGSRREAGDTHAAGLNEESLA